MLSSKGRSRGDSASFYWEFRTDIIPFQEWKAEGRKVLANVRQHTPFRWGMEILA